MDSKFYVSNEAYKLLRESGCTIDGRIAKTEAIDWLEVNGLYIDLISFYGKWACTITTLGWTQMIDMELFDTRLAAEDAAIIKGCQILK